MNADTVRGFSIENCITDQRRTEFMAMMLQEIAAQLAEMNQNLRDIHPELNLPEKCRERRCDYYTGYLASGPGDLTHEGFHAASFEGERHMKDCTRAGSCSTCTRYEQLLRA